MGGTTSAKTIVEAIEDLGDLIGTEGLEQYVHEWLDQHGVRLVTQVTDGNLTITIV